MGKKILYGILGAFLLCGVLHVVLFECWTSHFSQSYCSVFVLVWGISISWRIIDKRQRRTIIAMAAFMILLCIMQIGKYRLFRDMSSYNHIFWYGYYVPMTMIPVMLFWEALLVHRHPEEKLPVVGKVALGIGVLLCVLFVTNDIHNLVYCFPKGVPDDNNYTHNIVFYLYYVFFVVLFVVSFAILIKKMGKICNLKERLIPVIPIVMFIIWEVWELVMVGPTIYGIQMWNIGEVFIFTIMGFVEACIQIGLIPSNSGYENIFTKIPVSADVQDMKRQVVYSSAPIKVSSKDSIYSVEDREIKGGYVQWKTDVTELTNIKKELEETKDMLIHRRQYLNQQGNLLKEQATLDAQNELYNRIYKAVCSRIDKIEELLESDEEDKKEVLKEISLLLTFIKRRSNMELAEKDGKLGSDELMAALYETLESVKLYNINAALNSNSRAEYPQNLIIQIYEFVESVIEDCINTVEGVMIACDATETELAVRIMLKGKHLSFERLSTIPDVECYSSNITMSKDNDDVIISLTTRKRGGR